MSSTPPQQPGSFRVTRTRCSIRQTCKTAFTTPVRVFIPAPLSAQTPKNCCILPTSRIQPSPKQKHPWNLLIEPQVLPRTTVRPVSRRRHQPRIPIPLTKFNGLRDSIQKMEGPSNEDYHPRAPPVRSVEAS